MRTKQEIKNEINRLENIRFRIEMQDHFGLKEELEVANLKNTIERLKEKL